MKYNSITIARLGLAIVFLWFGINQLLAPENWISWLPLWIENVPGSPEMHIIMHGLFDTTVGILLFSGYFARIGALGAAAGLAGIISTIGYNDIAVRDFGLLIVALAVASEKEQPKIQEIIRYLLRK